MKSSIGHVLLFIAAAVLFLTTSWAAPVTDSPTATDSPTTTTNSLTLEGANVTLESAAVLYVGAKLANSSLSSGLTRGQGFSESIANAVQVFCSIYKENKKLVILSSTNSNEVFIQTAAKKSEEEACLLLKETLPNLDLFAVTCNQTGDSELVNTMCTKWDYSKKATTLITKHHSEAALETESVNWICANGHETNAKIQRAYGNNLTCPTTAPSTTTNRFSGRITTTVASRITTTVTATPPTKRPTRPTRNPKQRG